MTSIKITRRQFLKWLSASAAALGLTQTDILKLEKHLQAAVTGCDAGFPLNALIPGHPGTLARVIWIAGAACSGCPTSLLNYVADTADPDPVLNAIANNALKPPLIPVNYPLVDVESLYPVSFPGGGDGDIDIAEVVLEIVTIDYAQIIMAASGDLPNQHLLDLRDAGGYVLLVEGTIQTAANGKYCRIMDVPGHVPKAGKPWENYMEHYADPDLGNRTDITMAGATLWLAENAIAVIGLGTCATYGGIPAAKGSVTGGKSAWEWINQANSMGKIIVNVPGCPPHPDWFIATVGASLLELLGLLPGILLNNLDTTLDHMGRPKLTYCSPGNTIFHGVTVNNPVDNYKFCDDCPRFPTQPGLSTIDGCRRNAAQPKGFCLQTVGCNGYLNGPKYVRADCPTRKWNTHTNFCMNNNMPCQGCTDPGFPDKSSPFYTKTKNL